MLLTVHSVTLLWAHRANRDFHFQPCARAFSRRIDRYWARDTFSRMTISRVEIIFNCRCAKPRAWIGIRSLRFSPFFHEN